MGTLIVKRVVVSTMFSGLKERSNMGMVGSFFQVAREVEGFCGVPALVLVRLIGLESKGNLETRRAWVLTFDPRGPGLLHRHVLLLAPRHCANLPDWNPQVLAVFPMAARTKATTKRTATARVSSKCILSDSLSRSGPSVSRQCLSKSATVSLFLARASTVFELV